MKDRRDSLLFLFNAMDDEKTGTVDPKLRLAVVEALKTIPGFEALMAEVAKRSTGTNQTENCKEDEEGDKDKDGDNTTTDDGKYMWVCYC